MNNKRNAKDDQYDHARKDIRVARRATARIDNKLGKAWEQLDANLLDDELDIDDFFIAWSLDELSKILEDVAILERSLDRLATWMAGVE